MKGLVLIGGGGHCRACIDVIEAQRQYHIRGILDAQEPRGTKVLGYDVLGGDEMIHSLVSAETEFLITVGQLKTASVRQRIYETLISAGAQFATVVSPRAHVSSHAIIGAGSIIMPMAVVNAGASIGANCIINSGAIVEHDCVIGDMTHISTGARVNGTVSIGSNVFVGSGTIISNNINICDNTVLGAGSLILKDIDVAGVYKGIYK